MSAPTSKILSGYSGLVDGISDLLEAARRASARAVNALMTAAYWEIGRRIVEFEQRGKKRAGYGQELLSRLSVDLTSRFGRGFGVDNLELFRAFYLTYSPGYISETLSRKSESPHRKLRGAGTPRAPKTSNRRISPRRYTIEAWTGDCRTS